MLLSDIKKSISEMNDDELRSLLIEIRQNRRTSKRASSAEKAKKEASVDALMAGMTPEMIEKLLRQMGG